MNQGIVNTLQDDTFFHPNGFGYDFSTKSEITFIMFLGHLSSKFFDIKGRVLFWKDTIKKETNTNVNIIVIGDVRENKIYGCNYQGVEGVCTSIWELSQILLEKLYLQGTTKRTIVFGDCGGAIPAILSSTIVPYHSVNFTTPYCTIMGSENEFDINEYSLWYSRDASIEIYNTNKDYQQYYDTLKYYDQYTENPNNILNLYWSSTIKGTDLYFRNKANLLAKRPNLKIVDYKVPNHIEGHLLASYLYKTNKLQKMVADEVDIQKKILDNNKM
jgi:hypothetical protein